MLAHLLILIVGYFSLLKTSSIPISAMISVIIAHSMACIAFLAHELSHNTIIRFRPFRYCLEVFFWALNLIPATVWRRVHNQTHHVHTNTPQDPDRRFLNSEESVLTRWYSRLFYPHRHIIRWNPLVAFHFVPYILRNTIAAFYPNSTKPTLVPFKPLYSPRQRIKVMTELIVIVGIQVGVFHAVGSRWTAYLWASPIAVLFTSAIVMAYIFTNHFLNPVGAFTDPLAATTSVVVHPIFDRLHSNFSYHTEHHLFPQMNSDYYPQVSELLRQHYRGRYHRLRIAEAWSNLWAGEAYAPNNTDPRPRI